MQVSTVDVTLQSTVGLKRLSSAPLPQADSPVAVDAHPTKPVTPPVHCCTEPGCTRRFNRKYTLVEHMKTHTGEKPHVCPVKTCAKRFSTSGNLSRHKRLHGYIEPLECPVEGCLSSFPSNNKLEKHMKFHLGSAVHVCTIRHCGKTFSTTGNLNRHIKHQHQDVLVASGVSSPSQFSAPSPTSAEQQSTSSYTSLLLESSMEVAHPPAIDVSNLPQFQSTFNGMCTAKKFQVAPTTSKIATKWHSDEMVDVLTEIFDETVAQPESEIPECNISILDDMINFHVAHLP